MLKPGQNLTELATTDKTAKATTSPFADFLQEQADPRRYLAVILSYWWVVLLLTLIGTAAAAAFVSFSTPRYRATCRYETFIDERLLASSSNIKPSISPDFMRLLRARQMLDFSGRNLRKSVQEKLAPRWKNDTSSMTASVRCEPVKEIETMLDISVDSTSGEYALAYLRELIEQYETSQRAQSLENNENSMRSLWIQKKQIADELKSAQDTLLQFQKEHNIQFNQVKQQFDDTFLASLIQRQNALKMERTMLEAQFPIIRKSNTPTIQDVLELTMATSNLTGMSPATSVRTSGGDQAMAIIANLGKPQQGNAPHPVAATWQEQEELVSRLSAEYTDMLKTFKGTHPKMVELQRQTDIAKRELRFGAETAIKRLQARYEALKIQETSLEAAAKDWQGEINMSAADRATYENMQSKTEHLKKQHDQVYGRILDSAAQVDPTINRAIDPPRPIGQVAPNKPLVMFAGIALGLAAGILLSFLLDFFDTSMADVLAIEQKLGIAYLSSIPTWDGTIPNLDMKNPRVIVERGKASVPSEVYRSLRTSMESLVTARKGYALGVTSTDANEGKSLTTINLAAVFSWTGKRVLLVDGDLRRGRLQESFTLEQKAGITEYLMGKISDWHTIVIPSGLENLDLIQAGAYNQAAPELLDPPRLRSLIEEWGKEYDLIIFDTAPIGRVVDSAQIGRACDGMLLITRHGHFSYAGVRHAVHRLDGANIVGFCLNGIESSGKRGYYGNSKKFGGHYGYYSYDRYRYGQYGYGAAEAKPDAPEKKTDA